MVVCTFSSVVSVDVSVVSNFRRSRGTAKRSDVGYGNLSRVGKIGFEAGEGLSTEGEIAV